MMLLAWFLVDGGEGTLHLRGVAQDWRERAAKLANERATREAAAL